MPTSTNENVTVNFIRTSDEPKPTTEEAEMDSNSAYDEKVTRRLLRRIDFALIPFLACLYL
jgi:hypothetical protein